MKAIRIHSYGGPETLVYEDAPQPTPAANELLIKVYAASVNPVDRFTRAGYLQGMVDFPLPLTPGLDLAGVVAAIGSDVKDFKVGDEVYGYSNMMRQGSYAEYAVVGVGEIAAKPKSLDFVNAASVPLVAISAWQGLKAAALQPGQTLLIQGAGGGIGSFAVQFARLQGAKVIAVASTGKMEFLKELGADQTIDYTTTRFEDAVQETVHQVDAVLDAVGGEVLERSFAVVKPGGTLVTLAGQLDPAAAEARGVHGTGMMVQANSADLCQIAALIDAGKVKPVVSTILPLAEANKAHQILEQGHLLGKIVLQVVE